MTIENDSIFRKNAVLAGKNTIGPGWSGYKDRWSGNGISIDDLILKLESEFKTLIFNQTLINGRFKFEFPTKDFAEVQKHLREQYGINFVANSRNTQLYLISPD